MQLLIRLDIFEAFHIPLSSWIEAAVDWIQQFRWLFKDILAWPVDQLLTGLQQVLLYGSGPGFAYYLTPPSVLLVLLFLVAWWAANWRVAIFSVIAFAFAGFLGLWEELIVTLSMVLASVVVCVVVGVPLGIAAARSDRFAAFLRPILDTMQTTPAFVYLVPIVILFSIGTVPGVIATIIFSMPPIIRLTNLGIRQVHPEVVEAGLAFGSSPREILTKVQIPLAMPTIMAGLNQNIMLALAMVVIAAMIGAGGLGAPVFAGLNRVEVGLAAIGGVGIVLLAMVLDRITQGLGEKGPGKHMS